MEVKRDIAVSAFMEDRPYKDYTIKIYKNKKGFTIMKVYDCIIAAKSKDGRIFITWGDMQGIQQIRWTLADIVAAITETSNGGRRWSGPLAAIPDDWKGEWIEIIKGDPFLITAKLSPF